MKSTNLRKTVPTDSRLKTESKVSYPKVKWKALITHPSRISMHAFNIHKSAGLTQHATYIILDPKVAVLTYSGSKSSLSSSDPMPAFVPFLLTISMKITSRMKGICESWSNQHTKCIRGMQKVRRGIRITRCGDLLKVESVAIEDGLAGMIHTPVPAHFATPPSTWRLPNFQIDRDVQMLILRCSHRRWSL